MDRTTDKPVTLAEIEALERQTEDLARDLRRARAKLRAMRRELTADTD